jgi:predicted permease
VRVVSRIHEVVGDVQLILLVLLGAVGVVLLIACANIANMLLVRATERRRELAIRAAMGAWRGRLLRQLLSESVVLSLAGGTAGGLLAFVCFEPLMAMLPGGLPRVDEVALDLGVFLFLAAVSLGTGLLVGSLPAFRAAKTDVAEMLQSGGRGYAGVRRQNRTQALLVISEVALAFVLLFGATLLVRSFINLTSVERGFNAESILAFDLNISAEALSRPSRSSGSRGPAESASMHATMQQYVRTLEEELRAVPGVSLVATVDNAPFLGGTSSTTMTLESSSGIQETNMERGLATPPYFLLMGIPITAGRSFTPDDGTGSERVVIVSRSAANQYWPGEDPVGRRLRYGGLESDRPWRTIIGVAEDVHHQGLDVEPRPKVYLPFFQMSRGSIDVLLKTIVEPAAVVGSVRDVVQRFDPTLPAPRIRELERVVHASVAAPRFRTRLVSLFAVLAGLLAVIGVYGVLSYSMAQRSAEIGVTMALGASAPRVVKSVLLRGSYYAAAGLAVGVAICLSAVRVLDSFLFETNVHDPLAFVLAALVLAAAALCASYLPARRATKIDPVEALRAE